MDLGAKQKTLINYAGLKTAEELGAELGIPPEEVLRETNALLKSLDYLDLNQMRARLIIQMGLLAEDAKTRLSTLGDREYGSAVNAVRSLWTGILKELRDQEKASQVDVEEVNRRRAHELVSIVEKAYYKQLGRLEVLYPEVDQAELVEQFNADITAIASTYVEDAL